MGRSKFEAGMGKVSVRSHLKNKTKKRSTRDVAQVVK
jgi:hypothetical protein